jgi:hypothetical protein
MRPENRYSKLGTPELAEIASGTPLDQHTLDRAQRLLDEAEAFSQFRGLERVDALTVVLHDHGLAHEICANAARLSAALRVNRQHARRRLLALALT